MNNYQSIATINSPEFINLQPLDLNPGLAKCEIKVLYLGNNRNGTSIDKEAARSMAKTLRGAPIVGYYKKDKEDFFDHGDQVIYDGEGVHFNVLTQPYGFVSPVAEVWFQDFEETDDTGKSIVRTYLMTTGFLWVGQFDEAKQVLDDGGKPQSMELEKNSLQGFWSKEENSLREFFIINDAIFSKLCLLGDDVEPCFEGAAVTEPNVSRQFTLDENYKKTLFQMMQELQYTLQGGSREVEDEIKKQSIDSSPVVESEEVTQEVTEEVNDSYTETPTETPEVTQEESTETPGEDQGDVAEGGEDAGEGTDAGSEGGDSGSTDYAKKDNSDDKEEEKEETESDDKEDEKEDDDEKEDKYALLVTQFEELKTAFEELKVRAEEAEAKVEAYSLAEKDALIAEFSMLSEEDKKDVIEHKTDYTLDEIKSKLAVICYDKKINYVKEEEKKEESSLTVDMETTQYEVKPEWLQAVDKHKNQ